MSTVTVRDLRNHGGEVLRRVARGERVEVTMDGDPVAAVVPLPRAPLNGPELLRRWRHLPALDPESFRRDVDDVVDQSL